MPKPRLNRNDPQLWHLDVHHGLSAVDAIGELCAAWREMVAAGGAMTLHIVHGYGKSGRGGEIYFAVHQVLAHNRGRVRQRQALDPIGRVNPGATLVEVARPQPLQLPVVLRRLAPARDSSAVAPTESEGL